MTRFRRYLFTYFTWKTLLNHVFEDLRKPKAPNSSYGRIGAGILVNNFAIIWLVVLHMKAGEFGLSICTVRRSDEGL
jgi:hypothetical protein